MRSKRSRPCSPDWGHDPRRRVPTSAQTPAASPTYRCAAKHRPPSRRRTMSPRPSTPPRPPTDTPGRTTGLGDPRASRCAQAPSRRWTGTLRPRQATRWTRSRASLFRSSAGRTRPCTSTSRGPSGGMRASRPPPSPTRSTGATCAAARRACRWPSTWPPPRLRLGSPRVTGDVGNGRGGDRFHPGHAPAVRRHPLGGCRCR